MLRQASKPLSTNRIPACVLYFHLFDLFCHENYFFCCDFVFEISTEYLSSHAKKAISWVHKISKIGEKCSFIFTLKEYTNQKRLKIIVFIFILVHFCFGWILVSENYHFFREKRLVKRSRISWWNSIRTKFPPRPDILQRKCEYVLETTREMRPTIVFSLTMAPLVTKPSFMVEK